MSLCNLRRADNKRRRESQVRMKGWDGSAALQAIYDTELLRKQQANVNDALDEIREERGEERDE